MLLLLSSLGELLLREPLTLRGSEGGVAFSEGGSDAPPCGIAGWGSEGVSVGDASSMDRMMEKKGLL